MSATGFTRRGVLQGGVLRGGLALCPPAAALAAAEASEAPEVLCPVSPAALFVESVGVNTHLSSEPYASGFSRFRAMIGESGIRHLRDEIRASNDLDRWGDLFETFGIRSQMLVSPSTNTVPEMLDYIGALGPRRLTAIEGQNEGDSPWFIANPAARGDWSATTVAFQREVYRALRPLYSAETLPVVSPSVLDWKPADARLIRAAADYCDIVAIHPYVQRGQEPETREPYAALAWYLRNMRDGFKPGAPVMATEAGYSTIIRPKGAGVSQRAAAAYLPRLLLHNFECGVVRTFLYAFMDGGTDPNDSEHHWGLLLNDGTPKPAFHAVRALMAAMTSLEGGARGATGASPSRARILAPPPGTHGQAFRKRNGNLLVALWRDARCWDPAAMTDTPVAAQPVRLKTEGAARARSLDLRVGARWTDLGAADGVLAVPVAAEAVLVDLSGPDA